MTGRALVVGAGINGLCTAFWLDHFGWSVEIYDSGPIPNPQAASFGRHRLVHCHGSPFGPGTTPCSAPAEAALTLWDRLWQTLKQCHFARTGVIAPLRPGDDARGMPRGEILDAHALARRFALLAGPDAGLYCHDPDAGLIYAQDLLAALAGWLRDRGVQLSPHQPVRAVCTRRAAITLDCGGTRQGDVVVLAAGQGMIRGITLDVEAAALFPQRAIKRSYLVYCAPASGQTPLQMPSFTGFGGADDLWGTPAVGGIGMKLGSGAFTGNRPDPSAPPHVTSQQVIARFRRALPALARQKPRVLAYNHWVDGPAGDDAPRLAGKVLLYPPCRGGGFKSAFQLGLQQARRLSGAAPADPEPHARPTETL